MNSIPKPTTKYFILAAVFFLSIAGGVIAIYTTANGPWGYSDPVVYISTARSLDRGQGLVYYEADAAFRPLSIQPAFYSIVLGAIGLFQVDLVPAARWLNIFAFVASIFIAGWIFYRYSRAPALGVLASALLCAFPWMVVFFSSAYSEPLFVFLFLCSGWALLAYLQKEKTSLMVLSAVVTGLLPVTRYAGLGVLLAGGVCLLSLSAAQTRVRIKRAVLFMAIASLPILAWLVWIYFATAHSLGGRNLGVSWEGLAGLFQAFRASFMDTVWKWVPFQSHEMLLRYRLRFAMMGIGLAASLVLIFLAGRWLGKVPDGRRNSGLQIFTFFGLSSLLFLAVVLATYLFTVPTIDIDNRMLLPLYAGSVMNFYALFAVWQTAWFRGRLRGLQVLPWLVAVVCIAWYLPQTRDKVQFYHAGDGLTAYRWNHSGIIQAVRDMPSGQAVISNDWELLQLWTGRPIRGFWNTFPDTLPIQTGAYGSQPGDPAQSVFCQQGAALVVFKDFPAQFRERVGEVALDQMAGLFAGLTVSGSYPDGKIYLCR